MVVPLALTSSISSASRIITGLLDSNHSPLDLVRSAPADIVMPTAEVPGPQEQA
jgi:hypothetical protein